MSTLLEMSIVRVLRQRRSVIGAGFLVSEKHIVTCSHVVSEAIGIPNQSMKGRCWAPLCGLPIY